MKKYLLTFIFTLIPLILLSACSSETGNKTEDGREIIKVALSDEVNPPFLYTDENNHPIGYDMGYLKEIEKKLPQYKFEYQFGEEETNLVGLDAKKFDLAINWFFKTPEREEKFLYPKYEYGYSLTALITRKDRDDIQTLDDMVGKKLAPMPPGGGLRAILNGYNKKNPDRQIEIETIDQPSNADNLKRVSEGKADAAFLNKTTFDAIQKELNLDLKIGGIVSKEPVYVVFRKDHEKLVEEFDQATKELIEDGTLSKLSEKWFGTDIFQDLDYINEKGFEYSE